MCGPLSGALAEEGAREGSGRHTGHLVEDENAVLVNPKLPEALVEQTWGIALRIGDGLSRQQGAPERQRWCLTGKRNRAQLHCECQELVVKECWSNGKARAHCARRRRGEGAANDCNCRRPGWARISWNLHAGKGLKAP